MGQRQVPAGQAGPATMDGAPGRLADAAAARAVAVLLAGALMGVAACTPAPSGPTPAPSATSPGPEPMRSPSAPTPAADGGDAGTGASSTLPAPPGTDPPATAAGPLTGADLPSPEDLGSGWVARVEEGDAEDGPGNGTPYQRRDPAEIVEVVVPLGCTQRSTLPDPDHALQATYSRDGDFAVALLLQFESSTQATSFAQARTADLRACRDQPRDDVSGAAAPVVAVTAGDRLRAEYVVAEDPGTRWASAMWRHGDRVLIVDATTRVDLRAWPGA